MNKFKGKIVCKNCGKNYKFKSLRKNPVYICSGYSNYGKEFCTSFFIEEKDIDNVINRHLEFKKMDIVKPLEEYIKLIEVVGRGYKIIYEDNTASLINVPNENGMMCVRY